MDKPNRQKDRDQQIYMSMKCKDWELLHHNLNQQSILVHKRNNQKA